MAQTASGAVNAVPKRILGTLLSSLSGGVVPRIGAPYIAIGRTDEIDALATSLDRVADGEGAAKFIIGRYGSGKSFLIQLSRGYAMDAGFVTADCDLSPERKLAGAGGLATFRELMKNVATKTAQNGGALPMILGQWLARLTNELTDEHFTPDTDEFRDEIGRRITAALRGLEGDVGGFDFAAVLRAYYAATLADDGEKQSACLKWMRGEYNTRTEARAAVGIRSLSIITDESWYDFLKLFTAFVRLVGYAGLCVYIDECVNLYKIPNRISRENNYEKILAMFNDTMQGRAPGLMIVFGGTPQFLEDTRRGLYSYEALRSRLADGRFGGELRSLMQPVLRLKRLSDAELLALILRLSNLHGTYYHWDVRARITEEEMRAFLESSLAREGAESMITPREIIRDFVTLLDLLYANPDKAAAEIIGAVQKNRTAAPADTDADGDAPAAPQMSAANAASITLDDLEF